MNLIETFQNLVAQVPELVQPLIVALAGAVPFIEGEGAVTIGILGGIHPIVAAVAAVAGNLLCVTVVVLLTARARAAVVNRRHAKTLVGADGMPIAADDVAARTEVHDGGSRKAARRAKFQRAFERYGVPGVSLLGPLLLPTMFTATMLITVGVGKVRVIIWQAVAIIAWTTLFALLITGVVQFAAG